MIWSFVINIFCQLTDFIQYGVHQNEILVLKILENEYCVEIIHNFAVQGVENILIQNSNFL